MPKVAFPVAQMVKAAGMVNKSSLKQRRHKFESDEEIILYYFLSASFADCCKLTTQLTSWVNGIKMQLRIKMKENNESELIIVKWKLSTKLNVLNEPQFVCRQTHTQIPEF